MIGFYISGSVALVIYFLQFLFAYLEKNKIRKAIKPFCLISLMVSVYFLGARNELIFVALAFGLLGDIFLIFDKKKICFACGVLAFLVNHIVYIILFSSLLSYKINTWIIVSLSVFGVLFPLLTYKLANSISKEFAVPGSIYFYILFMECLFATLLVIDTKSMFAIMILLGNIFFVGSDTFLSITTFLVDVKRKHLYIMSTYLIAQTLISIGLCFLMI